MARDKIDSISEHSKIHQSAGKEITPPEHMALEDDFMVFFDNVIAEFAKSEWSDHQLEIACVLARTLHDVNAQQKHLKNEGYVIERGNGTMVENPRMRVVKSLTGDILSLRRSLSLHARARGGEARDVGKRKAQQKAIQEKSTGVSDDDLIARPVH